MGENPPEIRHFICGLLRDSPDRIAMRFLPTILLYLIILPVAFGQNSLSDKPTRTVFSIRAVDDRTNAELPTQFIIRASLAKTKFVGASQPGKSFDFVLTRTDTPARRSADAKATLSRSSDSSTVNLARCCSPGYSRPPHTTLIRALLSRRGMYTPVRTPPASSHSTAIR